MSVSIPSAHGEPTLGQPWESLPSSLSLVRRAIEGSRDILRLAENWDGEGALRISEAAWYRTVEFLTRLAKSLLEFGAVIDPPDITPVPDGSIDLHWDRSGYELLISIPPDDITMASFYGDDRGSLSIRGQLDPRRSNEGLLLWLTKNR